MKIIANLVLLLKWVMKTSIQCVSEVPNRPTIELEKKISLYELRIAVIIGYHTTICEWFM